MRPVALTIAGSDPSGGAGLQADLKTFHRFGVYGEAVVTLVTVQNTEAVTRVEVLAADLVREQVEAVLADIPPQAVKTGALGNRAVIEALAAIEFPCPLVVDPVMISTHGVPLLDPAGRRALAELLLPRAYLFLPNLDEAAELAGFPVGDLASMQRAADAMAVRGARNVLVKGGHLSTEAVDLLRTEDGHIELFRADRIDSRHTHGTGCTYSAAITAELAKGAQLIDAIATSKTFITQAIRNAPGLGRGSGPLDHWAK